MAHPRCGDGARAPAAEGLSARGAGAPVHGRRVPISGRHVVAALDQAAVSGTSFLTTLLVGHLCAPEEFGLLVLVLSLVLAWEGVRFSFVGAPLTVFLPRCEGTQAAAYLGGTLVLHAGVLGAGAACFGVAAAVARAGGDARLAAAIGLGTVALAGWSAREHVRGVLFARLRPGAALRVDALASGLQLGGLAALIALGRLQVGAVLVVAGAAQMVAALVGLAGLRGEIVRRGLGLGPLLRRHWRFGRWMLAGLLAYTVASQAYPWFLNGMHGVAAAAALGACLLPLSISRPLVVGLANVITPELSHAFARGGWESLRRTVRRSQRILLAPLAALAAGLALGAPWILDLMYDGKYVQYSLLLSLLALQLVVVAWITPIQQAFLAADRPRYPCYATSAGAVATLGFGVVLAARFGVAGAAVGWLLAVATSGAVALVLYRRMLREAQAPAAAAAAHMRAAACGASIAAS
ncbi:MAG: polysaccharide biosynthesis C-terminal domain-containing protein [Planctomycetes bacterium]|nr:polysaccharide biosynthesis C-terminal domain-containing protein [Planctomycetota bacterium]